MNPPQRVAYAVGTKDENILPHEVERGYSHHSIVHSLSEKLNGAKVR